MNRPSSSVASSARPIQLIDQRTRSPIVSGNRARSTRCLAFRTAWVRGIGLGRPFDYGTGPCRGAETMLARPWTYNSPLVFSRRKTVRATSSKCGTSPGTWCRLPGDLHPTDHWPITASNSSTVRGQCTRHRLSRQTVRSSVPGSRSRSAVMGLMGISPPASCSSARASASEPSRRSAADKPRSRYGVQDGAMAIEEAGHIPRNPSHVRQFERFDHDLQRPDGQSRSAHPAVGRDLNGPRGMDHRQALWRQIKVHAFITTMILLRGRYTFWVS